MEPLDSEDERFREVLGSRLDVFVTSLEAINPTPTNDLRMAMIAHLVTAMFKQYGESVLLRVIEIVSILGEVDDGKAAPSHSPAFHPTKGPRKKKRRR